MSFDSKEASIYGAEPLELYRFTKGIEVYTYTSGDTEITYNAEVYAPLPIDRSEIEQNRELESTQIEISIPIDSVLSQEFISYAPTDPIWLTVYAGHHNEAEVVTRFVGKVEQAEFTDVCKLKVRSSISAMRRKIPVATYQQACNRVHYSTACGANSAIHHWEFKVGAIAADGVTIDANQVAAESATFVAYWNSYWTAEPNAYPPTLAWGYMLTAQGHRMMIGLHPSKFRIVVKARIPSLAVGDIVTVYRGCRRTLQHCSFYGRDAVYLGFDKMPSKNPFNGVK